MFHTILFPTTLSEDAAKNAAALDIHITSDAYNQVLTAVVQDREGDAALTAFGTFNIYIDSGVTIGSRSPGTAALQTGASWPDGVTLNIINNGEIRGAGGKGGAYSATAPGTGEDGGDAILCAIDCSITNNGIIAGGGGGGGGGNSTFLVGKASFASNGGGGAGYDAGKFGNTGGLDNGAYDGTKTLGGQLRRFTSTAGKGGNPGFTGDNGIAAGGSAGKAVEYDGNSVTYTDNGTTLGATS